MKLIFEKQLNSTLPLTEEDVEKLQDKTYFNGDEKNVGDVVLMAMQMDDFIEKSGCCTVLPLKFITLNERHFDLFEYDKRYISNELPTIKLKKNNK